MATLSVLIPNYNHAKLLPRSLDSLISQSRQPDQVVIVDDGSKDNSVEVIESYQKRYPFIELIKHPQNRGVIEACKSGMKAIQSDFLCGLASDDYMREGWIARSMEMADRFPEAGLIFGKTKIENEVLGKSKVVFFAEEGDQDAYWPPDRFRKLLQRSNYFTYISSSALYRRKALEEVGGFRTDLSHYSDTFAANVLGARHGVCYVSHVANVFVQSTESFSARNRLATESLEKVMKRVDTILKSGEFDDCLSAEERKQWVESVRKEAIETPIWHRYYQICEKRNSFLRKIDPLPLRVLVKIPAYLLTGLIRIFSSGLILLRRLRMSCQEIATSCGFR